jgi:hypothetical protein
MYKFLKTLHPGGIRTRDLLLRWPLCHAAMGNFGLLFTESRNVTQIMSKRHGAGGLTRKSTLDLFSMKFIESVVFSWQCFLPISFSEKSKQNFGWSSTTDKMGQKKCPLGGERFKGSTFRCRLTNCRPSKCREKVKKCRKNVEKGWQCRHPNCPIGE